MAQMTPAQWRQYADQWKQAGPELDRIRREELKNCRQAVPARLDEAGRLVYIVGDADILSHPKIALFCSVKCPGKPLYTFDHPANAPLLQAGARIVDQLDVRAFGQDSRKP
ncbi:MAG: hypothetical protein ABR497_01500, partial [Kiritimatiellia bacterium]